MDSSVELRIWTLTLCSLSQKSWADFLEDCALNITAWLTLDKAGLINSFKIYSQIIIVSLSIGTKIVRISQVNLKCKCETNGLDNLLVVIYFILPTKCEQPQPLLLDRALIQMPIRLWTKRKQKYFLKNTSFFHLIHPPANRSILRRD